MRRRVFIAINLDSAAIKSIEKTLDGVKAKIPQELVRDVRFIPKENWHITVSFLGLQDEDGIIGIVRSLAGVVHEFRASAIFFDRLLYGPPGKQPRMIWILANKENSLELGVIKERLENEMEKNGVRFDRERRPFSGHITLARFDLNRERAATLPVIGREINISSGVLSLDLMESELGREGAEYPILQKFSLP